jgi:hypothetical protein
MSPNSVRDVLKPVVLALATLLPMTRRSVDAAFRPLSAIRKGISKIS